MNELLGLMPIVGHAPYGTLDGCVMEGRLNHVSDLPVEATACMLGIQSFNLEHSRHKGFNIIGRICCDRAGSIRRQAKA